MPKHIHLLVCLCLLCISICASAKPTYGMRAKVYADVQKVQALLEQKQWQDAVELIEHLQKQRLSDYELAQTWDIKGMAFYQQNKLALAIQGYTEVVNLKEAIPEGMYQRALRTLAQLNMMADNYQAAIVHANELVIVQKDADIYMLLAQAHYRLDQFEKALISVNNAKEMQKLGTKQPKETWLQLENAIHHALSDYPAMLKVLQQLVLLYPKPEYVLYMASVYGELDQLAKQTTLLESLYERGELKTEGQLLNLASLYVVEEVPYKGALLLEKALANGQLAPSEKVNNLLVSAWTAAKEPEKAMTALQSLVSISGNSDDQMRLAYQYFDLEHWQETVDTTETALNNEDLSDPGNALILLGMAQMKQDDFDLAQQTFIRAAKHEAVKKLASQWLHYAEQEQQKHAELATLGIVLPERHW